MSVINRIMKTGFIAALAITVTTGCGEVDNEYEVVTVESEASFTAWDTALPQQAFQVVDAQRWTERPSIESVESIWSGDEATPIHIDKVEEPNLPNVERVEVDPMSNQSEGLESADVASGCVAVDDWKAHAWATCTRIDAELVEIGSKGEVVVDGISETAEDARAVNIFFIAVLVVITNGDLQRWCNEIADIQPVGV